MLDPASLLQTATHAARLGGDVLMRYYLDGVEIRNKSAAGGKSYDLVSDADIESEAAIANFLRSVYPDHELLGEESLSNNRTDAEHLWIIDPLDGTNNFAHQMPQFAVSIAYYHEGHPVASVVLNPARDDWFTATRGGGAFHNSRKVSVSDADSLSQSLLGCGFYYDRGPMMRNTLAAIDDFFSRDIHGIRRFGAAAIDLCYIGCGQFDGFFEFKLAPWDFAAGRLFVEEAGGKITDAKGDELKINPSSVVASNGKLHASMIEITSQRA
ncbi:Inositol-1-monophosphatase [Novipirellula aureliae]|uniref:Inositol-1-monophosphatase n=1 Tax=Novipirellula aureliae TaxID=2527966 RepID=A0A5C6E0J5_9BACT|nr:inositol monophosphatase family protein [Novipirellula aureliae]TWU41171.1 Inositol-1-monophosphatase [Novipirellula aureliae]